MNIKTIIKGLIPPVLLEIYLKLFHKERLNFFWEGIYKDFDSVPVMGRGHDGDTWINELSANMKNLLKKEEFSDIAGGHGFLPFLSSIINNSKDCLTILDFGGGLGIDYYFFKKSINESGKIKYYNVECAKVCGAGASLFKDDDGIIFSEKLPGIPKVDVIYIKSALQYIKDYKGLLRALSEYKPQYFLFVDLMSGNNPTYASGQKNVKRSVIPYWFINIGEIVELMSNLGYKLIYNSFQDRYYDQRNFPEKYRMKHTRNMLFIQIGVGGKTK